MNDERLAIGCMTGTSIDGLDAALVRAIGVGPDVRIELVRVGRYDIGPLADDLRDLASGRSMTAKQIATLALEFGELHARAVAELAGPDLENLALACVHGQTVHHDPPASWQMINAHPIAVRTGVRTVHDLRQADLVMGGQGAPITPIADPLLFHRTARPYAVVNLGGFCNMTRVYAGGVEGADVCACNQLLDGLARELLARSFDEGGATALSGWAQNELTDPLVDLLSEQARGGRSLGTGDELDEWVRRAPDLDHPAHDVLASACDAVGTVVARACDGVPLVIVAGGGVHNTALMNAIAERSRAEVVRSDSLGVPAESREAMAMAALGLLCADRVPITLRGVTGRLESNAISGSWVLP